MQTISKTYPYLVEEDDYYRISSISTGDDVSIELDKRLHVENDIFIAGGLTSNVDLSAGRVVIVHGMVSIKGIQATALKMLNRVSIVGDLLSRESVILGAISVEGNMISFGNVKLVSVCNVTGKAALKGTIETNGTFAVDGLLYVDGVLNAKDTISVGTFKVNGKKCTKYLRYVSNQYTMVMYDESMSILIPDVGWKYFKNIKELTEVPKDEGNMICQLSESIIANHEILKKSMNDVIV